MSSQVQWLLLLHCADKVARCIVLGIIFFLLILRHTHTPWFGICLETKSLKNCFLKPMFLFYCWFLTVLGTRVRGVFRSRILVCFLAKSVCSFECCCVLSLGEGGGGVLFCIKTSGMSITLLIEQNVYRYNALTDTLSLLFTTHRERFRFEWHLSFFFSFFTFFFFQNIKTVL